MSNSKQTSNRSKIRAGQTYYRVANIIGKWEMQTLRPNGVKFPKHKLSRTVGHIHHIYCTNVNGWGYAAFDPKKVFYGQTAEQLAENNFVQKVEGQEDSVLFNSTAFIRKPKSNIECLAVATARRVRNEDGKTFYSVVCSSRESSLGYAALRNESQYVEQGFIRGGQTNRFGHFQPKFGVFRSKRDANRFLKEILEGRHQQLFEYVDNRNKEQEKWDAELGSYYDDYYDDHGYAEDE
jgi:hypothetical protein